MAGSAEQFLLDIRAKFDTLTPAQSALAQIEKQLIKEKEALAGLEKKLAEASPQQKAAIEQQIAAQKKNIATLEQAIPAWRQFAAASQKDIGVQTLERLFPSLKQFTEASEKGELAALALSGGIGIAAKAAAAFVAAFAIATVTILGFALYAGDAARSSHLLEVAAAGSAIAGTELVAVVSQLARRVPLAREEISKIARGLIDAKLAGIDMQNALTAIAFTASARGQQAASAIENIAKQSAAMRRFMIGARDARGEFLSLQGTGIKAADVYAAVAKTLGISVAQAQAKVLSGMIPLKQGMEILATVAKDKFGGTIAGQMLALTTQIPKAKENLGALFSGVNLDKFLAGLAIVTGMLSQDTYFGHALKTIFSTVLTGFFDTASAAFPYVRAALIGVAIGALTVYLYFLRIKKAVSETLGPFAPLKGRVDGLKLAMYAGIGIVGALVGVFLGLAAAIALALVPLALLTLAVLALVAVPILIGYAFYKGFVMVKDAVAGAWAKLKSVDLSELGQNAIESLIRGIAGMAGKLASAVAGIAGIIPATVASTLLIHSPSRIAVEQGSYYAQGMAIGAKSGEGAVEEAAAGLAGAAMRGGASGGSSGGAGRHLEIKELHFHIPHEGMKEEVRAIVIGLIAEEAGST